MFTVVLICSDEPCDHTDEFVGTLEDAEIVLCDGCGCLMQVVGVEDGHGGADLFDLAAHRARRAGAPGRIAA